MKEYLCHLWCKWYVSVRRSILSCDAKIKLFNEYRIGLVANVLVKAAEGAAASVYRLKEVVHLVLSDVVRR